MENHNVSTSNILLKMLGDGIPITATSSTPTKDTYKDSIKKIRILLPQLPVIIKFHWKAN